MSPHRAPVVATGRGYLSGYDRGAGTPHPTESGSQRDQSCANLAQVPRWLKARLRDGWFTAIGIKEQNA